MKTYTDLLNELAEKKVLIKELEEELEKYDDLPELESLGGGKYQEV